MSSNSKLYDWISLVVNPSTVGNSTYFTLKPVEMRQQWNSKQKTYHSGCSTHFLGHTDPGEVEKCNTDNITYNRKTKTGIRNNSCSLALLWFKQCCESCSEKDIVPSINRQYSQV